MGCIHAPPPHPGPTPRAGGSPHLLWVTHSTPLCREGDPRPPTGAFHHGRPAMPVAPFPEQASPHPTRCVPNLESLWPGPAKAPSLPALASLLSSLNSPSLPAFHKQRGNQTTFFHTSLEAGHILGLLSGPRCPKVPLAVCPCLTGVAVSPGALSSAPRDCRSRPSVPGARAAPAGQSTGAYTAGCRALVPASPSSWWPRHPGLVATAPASLPSRGRLCCLLYGQS